MAGDVELDDLERENQARQNWFAEKGQTEPPWIAVILSLISRCRSAEKAQTTAESNLACIADMLNTWARECNQREVTDYLGPCVLRDALKEQSGAANKREYDLRTALARWPEAVAKVRLWTWTDPYYKKIQDKVLDEVLRLATEERE